MTIDVIHPGGNGFTASGDVATRLMSGGMSINSLRTLDILKKEEWKAFDGAVTEVARKRLGAINDLQSAGLVYNLPNPLGHTVLEWQRMGDMEKANISMSGVQEDENEGLDFDMLSMPIPIIHKGFNLNIRHLSASRNRGTNLDTTQAELSSRVVSEEIERILFEGHDVNYGGAGKIFGLKNAPSTPVSVRARKTGTLTGILGTKTGTAVSWSEQTVGLTEGSTEAAALKGEAILNDVMNMIDTLAEDYMYGPYVMYVPTDYYLTLLKDYKDDSDKTTMSRILELPQITAIRQSHFLDEEVLMVQMTSDVLDLVNGFAPTLLQWYSHGGMVFHYRVMAIMWPRMKRTQKNQSGIAHFLGS